MQVESVRTSYWLVSPSSTAIPILTNSQLRSYPLGYTPTKDNPTTLPMTTIDEYPSIPSEPWLEPDDVPHNVTQEVINHWTKQADLRGEFPCRKIVFTIKSRDQGWGGPVGCRGTYKGSSTWFDVGLETVSATRGGRFIYSPITQIDRAEQNIHVEPEPSAQSQIPHFSIPDPASKSKDSEIFCTTRTITPVTERRVAATEPPEVKANFRHNLDPSLDCLQKNKTAVKTVIEHVITWSCTDDVMDPDSVDAKKLDELGRGRETANGEYVRGLKVGDVVTVWGKARYGGWVNYVEEVKIEVFWAV